MATMGALTAPAAFAAPAKHSVAWPRISGVNHVPVQTISWRDGRLFIIDQTLLPVEFREIELSTVDQVWEAIRSLRVRGAPAIGVCAAFGVLVGLSEDRPTSGKGAAPPADARPATPPNALEAAPGSDPPNA